MKVPLILFHAGTLLICLTSFRPFSTFFNGSDLLYLLSVITLCIHIFFYKKDIIYILINRNPLFIPFILLMIGALLSLINSLVLESAVKVFMQFFFLFGIWIPLSIYLLDTLQKIKSVFISLIIASLFPIVIALSDYFWGTQLTDLFDHILNLNLKSAIFVFGRRFGTIAGHPNLFGQILIVAFPLSLWLFFEKSEIYLKYMGFIYMISILICCFITGSRTALSAIMAQTILFFFLKWYIKKKQKKILTIIMFVVFISFIVYLPHHIGNNPVDRFINSMRYGLGSYPADASRIESIKYSWYILSSAPIIGIGIENASPVVTKGISLGLHNTILKLWVSAGIFGLIGGVLFYVIPLIAAIKLQKPFISGRLRRENSEIWIIVLMIIVGCFLSDMVQPSFHYRIKWIAVILLYALVNVIKNDSNLIQTEKVVENEE